MKQPVDSVIFDMDGTLWDAVDSYVKVWDATLRDLGSTASVTRRQLVECMGLTLDVILDRLFPAPEFDRQLFLRRLKVNELDMMPRLGGRVYDGVDYAVSALAARGLRLFMVSNCGADGLPNFLRFTGLGPYFTDILSNGDTGLGKADNIRIIAGRHSLVRPVYVGDTRGDLIASHAAGIEMVHVTYGFGRCDDADYSVDSPAALVDLFDSVLT